MKLIAINDGHNASVVYLENGKIVAGLQEERVVRIKNKMGFPLSSLNYIISENKLKYTDIDMYIFVSHYIPINMVEDREERIRNYKRNPTVIRKIKSLAKEIGVKKVASAFTKKERSAVLTKNGVSKDRICFFDHHLAHAAAAYYGCGNYDEKVLIFTNDGAGDDLCATISIGHKGKIERIASVHMDHSIGELWALMTAMMGMVPLEHEYKIMGLAPYAPEKGKIKVRKVFEKSFEFTGDGLTWQIANGVPSIPDAYNYFRDNLEFMRFDWIGAGLQEFTEEFLVKWVRNAIRKTGIHKVVLGGGTFMNVKANKCIMEMPEVEDIFVFPSCSDDTNPFGAVYHEYFVKTGEYPEPVGALFLGRGWSDEEVISAYEAYNFKYKYEIRKEDDISNKTAELISEGNVVAWFQGREEFGARALGARSIVADPTKKNVIKEINEMIKNRDFWMPFAASILDVDADRYMENSKSIKSPYMIMTFDTTKKADEIEAATHPYDGTCRPQVVYEEWNPGYYRMISEFKKITGRGAILNTSFNLHGFPIVSAPEDAFLVMDESGLQYLAIGNYLIKKIS